MAEKSLHLALKMWYAQPGDEFEVPVAGYLIDLVRADGSLVEIQTRSFASIKPKLTALLPHYPVTLVHPIAAQRWLTVLDAGAQTVLSRRKSPKRGTFFNVFKELVYIADLLAHPHLTLEVVLIHDEEVQRDDGQGSWRRRRRSIYDRLLLEVVGRQALCGVGDYAALLPYQPDDTFTTAHLATHLGVTRSLAGKMTYCLRQMAVIEQVGKQRRAYLYQLKE